jgi:hypothetical protein
MVFAQGQPESRVHPQMIGVVAVLITCRHLIDSLAHQLEQKMIRMARRSRIITLGRRSTKDAEALIDLSHKKKPGIGSDLCALKINANGSVEIRPYCLLLFVTNCAHADLPPSGEFAP